MRTVESYLPSITTKVTDFVKYMDYLQRLAQDVNMPYVHIIFDIGFEDTDFQSKLCSSGSLMGVISGSHYNRAWMIHSTVSEALERLLVERFLQETQLQLPSELEEICLDVETYSGSILSVCEEFIAGYESFKESTKRGDPGYTAQYWMIYLDLMRQ